MQTGRGPDDVGERVQRAHLVEVHLVRRDPVDGGFGGGQSAENRLGRLEYRSGERRVVEDPADVGPGAGRDRLDRLDVHQGGAEAPPGDRFGLQANRLDAEPVHRLLQDLEGDADVHQGAEQHVPACAGAAVQPADHRRRATRAAKTPAPKPLSMLTTAIPGAHALSMASSAASPPKDAP